MLRSLLSFGKGFRKMDMLRLSCELVASLVFLVLPALTMRRFSDG